MPQEGIEWTGYDDFPSSVDLSAFLADLEVDALNNMTKEQEYDDFPSLEDLSAFLADLELDALNKTKEQSQLIINSKKSCVTSEEKMPGEIVTPQTVSFSDVVYGFVQEDYTEFTDFPSFESRRLLS